MRLLSLGSLGVLWLGLGCTVHHHYPSPPAPLSTTENDEVSECAPLLPAPEALADNDDSPEHGHGHGHGHGHATTATPQPEAGQAEPRIIPHGELKDFENAGTVLVGLATASLGATNFEVWRSSVPPGKMTPRHVHESEEVFVLLRGKGTLVVGEDEFEFEAPATVIAPANVPHQLKNTGEIPTDQIVIVGVGSVIRNEDGEVMDLPWRR